MIYPVEYMLARFWQIVSYDIGIDLGTANVLMMVGPRKLVVNEPSVITRQKKTKRCLAFGGQAKEMMGKEHQGLEVVRPLIDGVIADFDATEMMLRHYFADIHDTPGWWPKVPKPQVAIGIPSGVTEVERRAVQDAALSAGARKAYLVEEPIAAALGAGMPMDRPEGSVVVDIGGGTTEIAVLSLGGMVINKSLRIAGDEMDEAIVHFLRLKHNFLVGRSTAENLKIAIGSAFGGKVNKSEVVRGRNLETGLPTSIKITEGEVREAIMPILQRITTKVSDVIESIPPELVSDVIEKGVALSGGGALIPGVTQMMSERLKISVWVVDQPLTAVVRGCQMVVSDPTNWTKLTVKRGMRE